MRPCRLFLIFFMTFPVLAQSNFFTKGLINQEDVLFNIKNIFEVSGGVFDVQRDCIWVIGDSSGSAKNPKRLRVSCHSLLSDKNKTYQIINAENIDWEVITIDSENNLWILDVGDNLHNRNFVMAYKISAKQINERENLLVFRVDRKIKIYYKDGAMDVEAGFIANDKLYLIEKNIGMKQKIVSINLKIVLSVHYALPVTHLINMPYITDAVYADSDELFVLTYYGIFSFKDFLTNNSKIADPYKLRYWGQVESLVKNPYGPYSFIVGHEDGRFFKVE